MHTSEALEYLAIASCALMAAVVLGGWLLFVA